MFVYKSLCEYLEYSECTFNNRDASRNLLGMITGKSVCSGCALIFKEAMDRIGIECIYQNRESHHSWDIIKIDNYYHAIELTWDVNEKSDNSCRFRYFCRHDKDSFYGNKHHDIRYDREECIYPIKEIPVDKLSSILTSISKDRIKIGQLTNINGVETVKIGNTEIIIDKCIPKISTLPQTQFIRKDGSIFVVYPTGKYEKNVYEYVYFECQKDKRSYRATRIYTEMDLVKVDPMNRSNIADNLLSASCIKQKINEFNGYVGYVMKNDNTRYYSQEFEEDVIHKYR